MSVLDTLRAALRRERRDYTTGDLDRTILLLAIPMVLEMMMESVFAVADVFWVSHLGPDAVAVVGITEAMMTIIYALGIGLSMSATAVVARRTGEKDADGAARTAVQALLLCALVSALLGVVGFLLAPRLVRVLGGSDEVVAQGSGFARVMLAGNATVLFLFLINAIFRGVGDATLAMRTLWFANIVNIVLGPLLIFGVGPLPRMGVTGAAVATNIGRGLGVVFQLGLLVRGGGQLAIRRRHLRIDPGALGNLVKVASTGVAQLMISTTSWVGLVRIVTAFGSAVVAGYTISMRVIMFAILPAWGLSNAAATLVGQNLGAGDPDRAEAAVWRASRWNLYVLSAVGVVFVAAAGPIARLFTADPTVLPWATAGLRIISLGFPFYAYGLVVTSAFNGAGDTWTPTVLNTCCFWLWEIPLAWVLSHTLGFGPYGIFIAITLAFSTMALSAIVLFRRGRWRKTKV